MLSLTYLCISPGQKQRPKNSCVLMDPLFSPLLLNNGLKNLMSFVRPFGSIERRVPKVRICSCSFELVVGSGEQDSTFMVFVQVNNYEIVVNLFHITQCPRTDLNKRFLPKPMTTTG